MTQNLITAMTPEHFFSTFNRVFPYRPATPGELPVPHPSDSESSTPLAITVASDFNFPLLLHQSAKPVLVVVGSEDYPGFNHLKTALEELQNEPEVSSKFTVVQLDPLLSPKTLAQYGILSVPTTLLFKRNNPNQPPAPVSELLVGTKDAQQLKAYLGRHRI
jgi:thioredoxin-like negative regulator of GroEL